MVWTALLVLLGSRAESVPAPSKVPAVVQMTISAKFDKNGRWCSEPRFEATIKNSGANSIWLDLGKPGDELEASSYSVSYRLGSKESSEGAATGSTHDWGSIEYLRSPEATLLKSGESVARMVKLDGVTLSAGKARIDLSIRIHGTDDLDDPKVRTYELQAHAELLLRRRGICIEARWLTKR